MVTIRKLYLVPIPHMVADMGSLALALEAKDAGLGQELWQKHKEIVSGFWDSVDEFFTSMDVRGFMIYQDGLVADGSDGHKIVGEGIFRGSKNYKVIGGLLQKGAILVKTEELTLVEQERDYILQIAQSKSPEEREMATSRYRLAQSKLLRRRDEFIALRIGETLKESEAGILFIGAYHDILSKLSGDIMVTQMKDIAKVREYYTIFLSTKKPNRNFQQLADYLTSPITSLIS